MRRVLVLGGTAWLGQRIADAALRTGAGAKVTCAARGESGQAPEGVTFVPMDRLEPDSYRSLLQDWDEVIELSEDPDLVKPALAALGTYARHWTLISSISVYTNCAEVGANESATTVEVLDTAEYAQAKMAAENATRTAVGNRLRIVRPGLIVGPGDPSDRFGYWPARLVEAKNSDVLVPTTGGRHVQVIDVDDLASDIARAGAQEAKGTVDAVGPSMDMNEFLAHAREVTAFTGTLVAVSDSWLESKDVRYWSGPRSLPLWLPSLHAPMMQRSGSAFRSAGGVTRPMVESLQRSLADERRRGLSRQRRSGLTRREEANLLRDARSEV